jgi:FHS family glucose/mannose:H+ symporter-like MFS transporter
MPSRFTALRFESLPAAPFYFGFMLTGLATVILGPILPGLSARWALSDIQAGYLFTAQFSGSTLGALLSSHHRRQSLVLGYACIAAGLLVLPFASYVVGLAAFFLLGLGLGSSITATNLIVGTEYPERRGSLLTQANFLWGVGAVSCPQLVAVAEHHGALRFFLPALALAALATSAVLSPLLWSNRFRKQAEPQIEDNTFNLRIFVIFSLILFLYVGGETSISGWITTYAHRFIDLTPAQSGIFVSAFWLAIVAGRGIISAFLGKLSELAVLFTGLVAAILGISVLLRPHALATSLAAVILAGFGCAPVFPLVVSRLIARVGRSRHVGLVFAVCGSGGAVIPWMTGLLSAHMNSLRLAFIVPFSAISAILLLVFIESALPALRLQKTAVHSS